MSVLPWCEKYRPKTIDEFIEPPKELVEIVTKKKDFPHLLFYGPPGTGKTTFAYIISRTFGYPTLELNASDERGIDVVRDKIKFFAGLRGPKIVLLDECDATTRDFQTALRRVMEIYSTCRFILTANYIGKIIEPIRSRCKLVEFKLVSKEKVLEKLKYICEKEGISYKENQLLDIVTYTFPDIRQAINALQYSVVDGSLVEVQYPFHILGEVFLRLVRVKDYKTIRKLVKKEAIDYEAILKYFFDKIFYDDNIPNKEELLIKVAERIYRNSQVFDPEINFLACCLELGGKI